jgi:hypothetical protein
MAQTDKRGRLLPTGECWCGCEKDTKEPGNFFLPGHDKVAESAVINIEYGGVAQFLVRHGYGPGEKNPRMELAAWRADGGTVR